MEPITTRLAPSGGAASSNELTGRVKEYTFTTTQGFSNQISKNGFNRNVHMKVLSPKASELLKQFIQFNLDRNFQRSEGNRNARSFGTITLQFPDYSEFRLPNNMNSKNKASLNPGNITAIQRDSRIIFDYRSELPLSFTLPLTQVITLLDAIGTPYVGYEYLPTLIKANGSLPSQAQIAEVLFDPMLKMRLGQAKKSMTNEEKRTEVNEIRDRVLRVLSMIDPIKSKSIVMREQIRAIVNKHYPSFLTMNSNRNGNTFISAIETELIKQTRNEGSLKDKIVEMFEKSPAVRDAVSRILSMEGTTNNLVPILSSVPGTLSAAKYIRRPLDLYVQNSLKEESNEASMRTKVTDAMVTAFEESEILQKIVTELMSIPPLPEESPYQTAHALISQNIKIDDVFNKLSVERATTNQIYIAYVVDIYNTLVKSMVECAKRKTPTGLQCKGLLDILTPSSLSNGNNASTVVPTYEMEKISTFTGNRMGKLSPSDFQEVIRLYTEMAKSLYQRSQGNVSTANKNALIQISSILSTANGNRTVKLTRSSSMSTLSTQPHSEYGNSNESNSNNQGTVALGGSKRKSKLRELLKAKTMEQLRKMMRRAGKKCSRKGVALRKGQMISALISM